ncbi:MAG: NRDE family protein [Spirochaetota bacterium]
MCTVSWKLNPEGYDLFFNRDEQITRKEALPPEIMNRNKVRFIAPRDAEAAGSWLAVNDEGICFFLLNHYPSPLRPMAQSRGNIILQLAGAEKLSEAQKILDELPLHDFAPFRIGVFVPEIGPFSWLWNGMTLLSEGRQTAYLTSSSYQSERVVAQRQSLFQVINPQGIGDFLQMHSGHFPEKGAFSICMHRTDAETVSFSHISVRNDCVTFRYCPGSPCASTKSHVVTIGKKSQHTNCRVA